MLDLLRGNLKLGFIGVVALLSCLILAPDSAAQLSSAQTGGLGSRGSIPGHTLLGSGDESVDVVSGTLTYHVPLASLPAGRAGFASALDLTYNSNIWDVKPTTMTSVNDGGATVVGDTLYPSIYGGWRYSYSYNIDVEAVSYNQYTDPNICSVPYQGVIKNSIVLPDGSSHVLHLYGDPTQVQTAGYSNYTLFGLNQCGSTNLVGPTLTYFTADGSYLRLVANVSTSTWTLYKPDGSWVTGSITTATAIYDRNGNEIAIQNNYNASAHTGTTTLTDDFNRSVTLTATSSSLDTITQAGYNGDAAQTWTVGYASFPATWFGNPGGAEYYCTSYSDICSIPSSYYGVSSITLPTLTGLSYTASYNVTSGYFELSSLRTGLGSTSAYSWSATNQYRPYTSLLVDPLTAKTRQYVDQSDGSNLTRTDSWLYSTTCAVSHSPANCYQVKSPDGGIYTYYADQSLSSINHGLIYLTILPDGSTLERQWYSNVPFGLMYLNQDEMFLENVNPYAAMEVQSFANGGTPTAATVKMNSIDKNGNPVALVDFANIPYSSVTHDGSDHPTGLSTGTSSTRSTASTYSIVTVTAGNGTENVADSQSAYWNPSAPQFRDMAVRAVLTATATVAGPGSDIEFSYDSKGNVTEKRVWDSIKAPGSAPASLATARPGSNDSITDYQYDATGHGVLTQITDPNGNVTKYTLDSNVLYAVKEVQAYGVSGTARTFTYSYDQATGVLTSQGDSDNATTTTYGYDALGRRTSAQQADLSTTTTAYNDQARSIVTISDLNTPGDQARYSVTSYDQLGRPWLSQQMETVPQNPYDITQGIKVQTRYLNSGSSGYQLVSNPFRASYSTGAGVETTMGWTLSQFDQNGRTANVTSFTGAAAPAPWSGSNTTTTGVMSMAYGADATTNTFTAATTDQAGVLTTNYTNGLGQLLQVQENGISATTAYQYDALDNLQIVTPPSPGAGRTFAYDSQTRLTTAVNPESGTASYTYDADGNFKTRTTPSSNPGLSGTVVTSYAYDALNRLTGKTYSDSGTSHPTPAVTYSYDQATSYGKGRVYQATAGSSSYTFNSYDSLGRPTHTTQSTNGQSYQFPSITYKPVGIATIQYPSGRIISTTYDGAGRPLGVSGQITVGGQPVTTPYASNLSYAAHGGVTQTTLGNGVLESTAFNDRLQTQSLSISNLGSNVFTAAYQHGASITQNNGNLSGQTITRGGTSSWSDSFTYDGANRLSKATESGGWLQTYVYDLRGNRAVLASSSIIANSLTPQTSNNTSVPFDANNHWNGTGYDLAGNLNQLGTVAFTYDAENRMFLKTDSSMGGVTASYTYDADGRRVISTVSGNATVFVYDPSGALAAEYSSVTPVVAGTEYVSQDYLGSVRLVSGAVTACHDYLPFGEEISQTWSRTGVSCFASSDGITRRFTGKERDAETGLDYFGARYMSSAQGRFTSPDRPFNDQDPSNPQSWNLYPYVRNNPLRSIDPTGRECVTLDSGAKGDDGQGTTCATANLDLTHGVTVYSNGDSISGVFGNAAQRGDLQIGSIESETASIGVGIIGGEAAGLVVGRVGGAIADLFGGAGRTAATTAARVTRGGLGPVLKGTAGVERAAAEIEAEGGQVLGREITIENSAGRARVDIAYRDASGDLRLGEAKNGPTADLNPNQQRVYGAAQTEGARLVGGNAQSAGLPSTIGPGSVRVFKY